MTISAHPGRLLWHHEAHTMWGDSQLQFWFINFRHSYDPDEVLPALHKLAAEKGLTAYASYELLGPFDIMLRLYVPNGGEADLIDAVESLLSRHDLKMIRQFAPIEVARHWPWARNEVGTGPTRNPAKTTLRKRRPAREIAIINENGRIAERPKIVELDSANRDLLNTYIDDRLVTFANRSQGIRLVTSVSHSEDIDNDVSRNLTRQLARALDKAVPLVEECSLYRGARNHQMLFVLMYRVSFANFHKIRREFLQNIREIVGAAGASTLTSVIVSDDVKCFADALPEDTEDGSARDFLELLHAEESRDFEVKGSALARLDPWLDKDTPLEADHGFFRDTTLKTITGFLNTRGGILVVGALETEKIRGKAFEKLRGCPTIGPHICVGLMDPLFTEKGWDSYLRQVSDLIARGIDPGPGALVTIDREKFDDRDLMVIRVEEPADDQEYYVPENDKTSIFYARVDNRTVPLRGPQIKRHMRQVAQRRNRRATRSSI